MRQTKQEFIAFLRTTLIPDLRKSGFGYTADDFKTAVDFMEADDWKIAALNWKIAALKAKAPKKAPKKTTASDNEWCTCGHPHSLRSCIQLKCHPYRKNQ